MRKLLEKDVLTTGQVAKICHVAPRTVSKWFDTGRLQGYRIPGSKDRRIPAETLLAFMEAHGMPLDGLTAGVCRLLLVSTDVPEDVRRELESSGRYEIYTAPTHFAAGLAAQQHRPHVALVDVDAVTDAEALCRQFKSTEELQAIRIVAVGTVRALGLLPDEAFDGSVTKPYTVGQLAAAVEKATDMTT